MDDENPFFEEMKRLASQQSFDVINRNWSTAMSDLERISGINYDPEFKRLHKALLISQVIMWEQAHDLSEYCRSVLEKRNENPML